MNRFEPLRTYSSPVAARGRAHRRRVGAGARLGERVRAQPLAAREPRQVALLLLVAAGELEPERAELLHREDEAARRADLRDLLDRDQREQRAGAEPAELLLVEEAEDVVLAVQLDDVPRELVRLVDLGRPRRDPLARERPHEVADLALLVAQLVPGHQRSGSYATSRRRDGSGSGDTAAVQAQLCLGTAKRVPWRRRRATSLSSFSARDERLDQVLVERRSCAAPRPARSARERAVARCTSMATSISANSPHRPGPAACSRQRRRRGRPRTMARMDVTPDATGRQPGSVPASSQVRRSHGSALSSRPDADDVLAATIVSQVRSSAGEPTSPASGPATR